MKINAKIPINFVEWEETNQMYIINITKCSDGTSYCHTNGLNVSICYYPAIKKYLLCIDVLGDPIVEEWITEIPDEVKEQISIEISKHLNRK